MNQIYRNYQRRKFQAWKDKVKTHLPKVAKVFYSDSKLYNSNEKGKLLGTVIREINNYEYSIFDSKGNFNDSMGEMADQVLLEILVNDLFKIAPPEKSLPIIKDLNEIETMIIKAGINFEHPLHHIKVAIDSLRYKL